MQQGGKTLASARLIGTALSPGMFLADAAPALKGSAKSAVITTHEYFGDLDERLDFPADWDVKVQKMAGHDAPVLNREEIRRRIQAPIGCSPLREIAGGKKSAVVTFDDLTRPTPAIEVVPVVIDELLAAGVPEDRVILLTSFGTHPAMELDEVVRKLGKDLIRRFPWINHNIWSNLKDVGATSRKTPVKINQTFAAADLRVTISGIKIHSGAGYGGGAKAVLPGICAFETTHYNHSSLGGGRQRKPGVIPIFTNVGRQDMIEAARLAKVDFSVQVVYNGKRRTCGVFAGDIVEAHVAACRMALKHYSTEPPVKPDVVVFNTYPQARDSRAHMAWFNEVRSGGTGVFIVQMPQGLSSWHFNNEYNAGRDGRTYLDRLLAPSKPLRDDAQLIVFSQYLDKQQMVQYPPNTQFAFTWDETLRYLQARHKGGAQVAVYPYGAIQHPPSVLDE